MSKTVRFDVKNADVSGYIPNQKREATRKNRHVVRRELSNQKNVQALYAGML